MAIPAPVIRYRGGTEPGLQTVWRFCRRRCGPSPYFVLASHSHTTNIEAAIFRATSRGERGMAADSLTMISAAESRLEQTENLIRLHCRKVPLWTTWCGS